jgi:hypothetical protein
MILTFNGLQTLKYEQPLHTNLDLSEALVSKATVVE